MNLTKKQQIGVLITLILLVAVTIPFIKLQGAVYQYAKAVPIQIGYDLATSNWIVSAIIDERTAFKMVLNKDVTVPLPDEHQAQSKSEVGLLFEPLNPYSKTNMAPASINYVKTYLFGVVLSTEQTPSYDINDAGWLTTAVYRIEVYKNNAKVSGQTVEVDYLKPKVIQLPTPEGEVTINNLGIQFEGVTPPSGDLILVYDPSGNPHIFDKANFMSMVSCFNDYILAYGTFAPSWADVWNISAQRGWLPNDIVLTHVQSWEPIGTNDYITLTYYSGAFAGDISIYIPSDLADTVIVQLFSPNPIITKVTPDPLPRMKEGAKEGFTVTINNAGTEGTIQVTVMSDSNLYAFTSTSSPTGGNMRAGETADWSFSAYALNVESPTGPLTITIMAQGRGGVSVYTLATLGIDDVPGYTPPDTPPGEPQNYLWLLPYLLIPLAVVATYTVVKKKRRGK